MQEREIGRSIVVLGFAAFALLISIEAFAALASDQHPMKEYRAPGHSFFNAAFSHVR